MAKNARPSFSKRQKEQARKEQAARKEEKRLERKAEKEGRGDAPAGVDPDIAHIVPGPQPIPEE
ncbi:hypothetical protein [Vulgatibacter sp.]|uniref:hypothetical protein n=1 Tax=Vulgatibacter sp. TaxID=1971226 RepID=UPI0035647356